MRSALVCPRQQEQGGGSPGRLAQAPPPPPQCVQASAGRLLGMSLQRCVRQIRVRGVRAAPLELGVGVRGDALQQLMQLGHRLLQGHGKDACGADRRRR